MAHLYCKKFPLGFADPHKLRAPPTSLNKLNQSFATISRTIALGNVIFSETHLLGLLFLVSLVHNNSPEPIAGSLPIPY